MNIFKVAYRVVRRNSNEIYKGFSFRHLSDVTQYYVHPDNESMNGTTTLCQPIGEAIILFADFMLTMQEGEPIGDYYVDSLLERLILDVDVPEEYRENGVVQENLYHYRAVLQGTTIALAAYDEDGEWLPGNMEHLHPLYKLLSAFIVLLARDLETDEHIHTIFEDFLKEPAADCFVQLHEDFYQKHKREDYELIYKDLSDIEVKGLPAHSAAYAALRKNQRERMGKSEIPILPFPENTFTEEQRSCIPQLAEEFILPASLRSICNAVSSGDIRFILFHGPAGTGKTMSCKLIAQTIRLPIMETINCTENLDEFVLGKYLPQGSQIVFKESGVTEAIRHGGAVVFEEINFARPQYLAFLNSLLDDNGFVRLDTGERVKRHENFRFFATMNRGYFGTKELNQALYNRFNSIIEVSALSDDAISRMLVARVPECQPVVTKMLRVYHKLKHAIETEELDLVISPRNLENWARLAKYEGYVKAAERTIIPVARGDRTLEQSFRNIVMLYRWKGK